MICLDTNVVVHFLRGTYPALTRRFESEAASGSLALPAIALFELHYGIARSARRERNAEQLAALLQAPIAILPFEAEDSEEAGDIRAALASAGASIGPYDVLIAAQARRRDAILVTANTREFARVPRLRVESWV